MCSHHLLGNNTTLRYYCTFCITDADRPWISELHKNAEVVKEAGAASFRSNMCLSVTIITCLLIRLLKILKAVTRASWHASTFVAVQCSTMKGARAQG